MLIKKQVFKSDIGNLSYDFIYNILTASEGWVIGGGFARFIGSKVFSLNYNKNNTLFDYLNKSNGDIDLFTDKVVSDAVLGDLLPGKLVGKALISLDNKSRFSNNFSIHTHKSRFANNIFLYLKRKDPKKTKNAVFRFKLQYVFSHIYSSYENMMNDYDLNNSKWVLYKENDQIYLLFDELALMNDTNKLVSISIPNKNPYLSNRINKYVNERGMLNGVCEKSKTHLMTYMLNILNNTWEDYIDENDLNTYPAQYLDWTQTSAKFYYDKIVNNLSFTSVNHLLNCNALSANQLAMLIGKWKVNIKNGKDDYDYEFFGTPSYIQVDWASHKIKTLHKNDEN